MVNICKDCMFKIGKHTMEEEDRATAIRQGVTLTGRETKVWGFLLKDVDEDSIRFATSNKGNIGVTPDVWNKGIHILYVSKLGAKRAREMCHHAGLNTGPVRSGYIDQGYVDKATKSDT